MAISVRGLAPLLQVFDMPKSIRFYRDALGFELVETSQPGNQFDWALLRLGNAELLLNTAHEADARPPAADPVRIAAPADTAIYFGCPDVDEAYRHLRARGIEVEEPTLTSYGFKALSVTDPDGFHLCFQWPAQQ